MPTRNVMAIGFSDPMVYKGNKNNVKITKAISNSSRLNRRNSWNGEPERGTLYSNHHHVGNSRPSTSDTTKRNIQKKHDILQLKRNSGEVVNPTFSYQNSLTRPSSASISTQHKQDFSKLTLNAGEIVNPILSHPNILKRPSSSFMSTRWEAQNKHDKVRSNTGVVNPFVSCHNIMTRPSSSFMSSRWKTPSRNSSTQIKSKNASFHSFSERYQELCDRYCQISLTGVRTHLAKRALDFSVDRLKAEDWKPLLEALRSDQELHLINIRSRYPARKDTEEKANCATRCPVIFTQFFLVGLTSSLAQCLTNSNSLTSLELEGILLSPKYLSVLTEGLVGSKNLQHLSFEKCFVGDEGLALICMALRQLPRILTLNVTMCGITAVGMGHIVSLLKIQKMNRFVETWQQSLRYQIPNLDSMWGLRRITLNHNPSIGDEGVGLLCDVLDDDLWVKAIDLQRSGLGKIGANRLISLLNFNVTLAVVDIRENKYVPSALLKQILQLLSRNNKDRKTEYHWINLASSATSDHKPKVLSERNCIIYRKVTNQCISSSSPEIGPRKQTVSFKSRAYSQPLRR